MSEVSKKDAHGHAQLDGWLAYGHMRAWLSWTCTATLVRALQIMGHTLITSTIEEKTLERLVTLLAYIRSIVCDGIGSAEKNPAPSMIGLIGAASLQTAAAMRASRGWRWPIQHPWPSTSGETKRGIRHHRSRWPAQTYR
jgi:hypothetical protein